MELRHQWPPRNRWLAIVGFAAVLALQILVTAALERLWWENPVDSVRQLPPVLSVLSAPLLSPFPLLAKHAWAHLSPMLVVLQLSQWLVLTLILWVAPAFAARSLVPNRQVGPLQEATRRDPSPRRAVGAETVAAVFPFAALALAIGLLGAGLLLGAQLAGRPELLGPPPMVPTEFEVRPRPNPFTSWWVILGTSLVRWLSLLTLLGAIGAACRKSRVALGWCYAATLLLQPAVHYALTTLASSAGLWFGSYRTALVRVIVSILDLAVAAWLFRRALRNREHPDREQPWIHVRRPAIWDQSLSDHPAKDGSASRSFGSHDPEGNS